MRHQLARTQRLARLIVLAVCLAARASLAACPHADASLVRWSTAPPASASDPVVVGAMLLDQSVSVNSIVVRAGAKLVLDDVSLSIHARFIRVRACVAHFLWSAWIPRCSEANSNSIERDRLMMEVR